MRCPGVAGRYAVVTGIGDGCPWLTQRGTASWLGGPLDGPVTIAPAGSVIGTLSGPGRVGRQHPAAHGENRHRRQAAQDARDLAGVGEPGIGVHALVLALPSRPDDQHPARARSRRGHRPGCRRAWTGPALAGADWSSRRPAASQRERRAGSPHAQPQDSAQRDGHREPRPGHVPCGALAARIAACAQITGSHGRCRGDAARREGRRSSRRRAGSCRAGCRD